MLFRRRLRNQSGVTLIEMLVVVMLISVAILTFAVGLQTQQSATADATVRGRMQVAMGTFRSALTTLTADQTQWMPPTAGAGCNSTTLTANVLAKLEAAPETAGWATKWQNRGMRFRVVGVNYWVGGPGFPFNGTTVVGQFLGCGSSMPDNGAQEYLLEVTHSAARGPETGSVVVRKPWP